MNHLVELEKSGLKYLSESLVYPVWALFLTLHGHVKNMKNFMRDKL